MAVAIFDDDLKRLAQQIVRARALYDVWWLCAAKEYRDAYRPVFERYGALFRFLEHGLLIATVVQAYISFDGTKNTLSLGRAIKGAKKLGALDDSSAKALAVRLAALKSEVEAIRTVRHNAFAHLSSALSYDEAFTEAGLKPKHILLAIEEAMAVMNILLAARGLETIEPGTVHAEDGLGLLRDLTAAEREDGLEAFLARTSAQDGGAA